ncbi:hypothetical protein [Telmatospirillum sp.]|uniref:hypothetical protein n=1 Tax=Telmatospirillum sp. TaxID=2079197 RepID=UPI002842A732|nr:hypothetical protein [Telmatospirillum sp.]MDR3437294.1 hypothetical protein [Telmatospirillum sp.]
MLFPADPSSPCSNTNPRLPQRETIVGRTLGNRKAERAGLGQYQTLGAMAALLTRLSSAAVRRLASGRRLTTTEQKFRLRVLEIEETTIRYIPFASIFYKMDKA